jgi:translocation and assembly module TamB
VRRYWFWLAAALLLVSLIGGPLFLAATETGTRWVFTVATHLAPGELSIGSVRGTLSDALELADLQYRQQGEGGADIVLGYLALNWRPAALVDAELRIEELTLEDLTVKLPAQKPDEPSEPMTWPPPAVELPLKVAIENLTVKDIAVRTGDQPIRIDRVHLVAVTDAESLKIKQLEVEARDMQGQLSGQIVPHGQYPVDIRLQWSARLQQDMRLRGTGSVEGNLECLQIHHQLGQPVDVLVSGSVRFTGNQPNFDVVAKWQDLQWPPKGELLFSSERGHVQVQGDPEAYQIAVRTRLRGAQFPPAQLQAKATGDSEGLSVKALRVSTLDGELEAEGTVAWKPKPRWQVRLSGAGLNPAEQWPEWPGRVGFQAESNGTLSAMGPQIKLSLEQLTGAIRGHELGGQAVVSVEDGTYEVSELALQAGPAWVRGQGSLNQRWDAQLRFAATSLDELVSNAAGSLGGELRVQGPRSAPLIEGELEGAGVSYQQYRLEQLTADWRVDLQDQQPSHVTIHGREVTVAEQVIEAVTVQAEGKLEDHVIKARVDAPEQALKLVLEGGRVGNQWQGMIRQMHINTAAAGDWRLAQPVAVDAGAERVAVEQACWRRRQTSAQVCAAGNWGGTQGWEASARITALSLSLLEPWLPSPAELDGFLNGNFTGSGDNERIQARLSMTPSPGTVSYRPEGEQPITIDYRDVELQALLEQGTLTADLGAVLVEQGRMRATVRLSPVRPGKPLGSSHLQGNIKGMLHDLSLVSVLAPSIKNVGGHVSVDFQLAGTVDAPQVIGKAEYDDGSLALTPAAIELRDIHFEAVSQGGDGLRLQGSAESGPGSLSLRGKVGLSGTQAGALRLAVTGERFEAANLPQAHVLLSPALTLQVQAQQINVQGEVMVPAADIRIRNLPESAVKVSDDQAIKGADNGEAPEQPMEQAVHAKVQIKLGDEVTFEGFGLTARLDGALLVTDTPGKATQVEGDVRILEGRYRAYGQKLKITKGTLVFAGPPENPGLDVRAVREQLPEEIDEVGLQVTGTLKSPQLTLFSEPTMPETEILSYLVLGRPLGQASSEEGSMLANAALSLGLKGGNLLAKKIGNQLGLDEIGVESEGGLDTTQFVLGKYLSPKLYVSYAAGLLEAQNTFRVRYDLFKGFSVRAQGGTDSAVDVLYTIEYQ